MVIPSSLNDNICIARLFTIVTNEFSSAVEEVPTISKDLTVASNSGGSSLPWFQVTNKKNLNSPSCFQFPSKK